MWKKKIGFETTKAGQKYVYKTKITMVGIFLLLLWFGFVVSFGCVYCFGLVLAFFVVGDFMFSYVLFLFFLLLGSG